MGKIQKIIVILGPTASGKSDLAVKLAKKLRDLNRSRKAVGRTSRSEILGEVISADSRQVYRGLNIGTGKITKTEMRGVPHHLLGIANPKQRFTVADFVKLGKEKIADIFTRGKTPIICGGTGFYIASLLGEVELPPAPPNPKIRKRLEKKSAAELFKILQRLNPARAAKIDSHNPRRLTRAIELAKSPLAPTNLWESDSYSKTFRVLKIGLKLPPEELKCRIRARLRARMRQGLIAEVKRLHRKGLSWKRMEELGLEYRYLARYLQNKLTATEMENRLATEIWHYARRQMTWFKRDKTILWFSPAASGKIAEEIKSFLQS